MAQLPKRFTSRTKWTDLSASEMNALVDMTRANNREISALRSELARRAKPEAIREKVVVVTAVGEGVLTVTRVVYTHIPPQECSGASTDRQCHYTLTGDVFEAFPDFGWRAEDYRDDIFDPTEELAEDTVYLRAYMEESTWRLQRPAMLQRFVVESATAHPDTLVCTAINGSPGPVNVAKPYLLRVFPFSTDGRRDVTFFYATPTDRTAIKGIGDEAQEEFQIIVPRYLPGDVIYAMKAVINGSANYRSSMTAGSPIDLFAAWIDLNADSRAWTKATEEAL